MVGTIIDETANPIDVSATVIDLAVRGYLRIEENEGNGRFGRTDWTLTRLPPPADERLLPYERQLLDGIFATRGDVVLLSELKNTFASTLKRIQTAMYQEVVTRGWFRTSPQAQRGAWQGLGLVIAALGGLLLFYGRPAISSILGGGFSGGVALGIGLVLAGLIVSVLGGRMAAKTAEGSAVLAQALGFKEYLTTAEAGQIDFEEASNIFSRYLPYAVVFGVADRWATTFAEVAHAAEAANQPLLMPTWYVWSGATIPRLHRHRDGVDAFSTTSTGTFTSTPGSSGSSGFSVAAASPVVVAAGRRPAPGEPSRRATPRGRRDPGGIGCALKSARTATVSASSPTSGPPSSGSRPSDRGAAGPRRREQHTPRSRTPTPS